MRTVSSTDRRIAHAQKLATHVIQTVSTSKSSCSSTRVKWMNRIARTESKGFGEGENLRDSVGFEKQLNNVRYDWQGGENSIEHVD